MSRVCQRGGCEVRIERKPRESVEQTARRRFCSLACYRADVAVERPTRECGHCGRAFGPSRRERAAQFVKRAPKYCSQACNGAAKTARATPEGRTCAGDECGAEIVRRPGEQASAFRARKFCGAACAGAARRVARPARTSRERPRVATRAPRPKPTLTVFGDVAPAQPWRPVSFSAAPRAST